MKALRNIVKKLVDGDDSEDDESSGSRLRRLGGVDQNDLIDYDDIIPLKKYIFEGHDFYGPNNADSFLSQRYGNYMKLPPPEDQKPHYSSVQFLERTKEITC